MGEAMTRVYRKGVFEAEGFAVADVPEYLDQRDTVVWVDLCAPSKQQLHTPPASSACTSDALGPHQRPKLDRYATHLFLSCQAVHVDTDNGVLEATEVDAFIHKR
jgi:magnesium transporter